MPPDVGIIWCGSHAKHRVNGWAFPKAVERVLQQETTGRRVLHLFGGQATWGVRLDVDASTRPDVLGDAWLPPFQRDAFDDVILDPPYMRLNQREKQALLEGAAYVARQRVWWFSTVWLAPGRPLAPGRNWFVRVGRMCQVRCLQEFLVNQAQKRYRRPYFTRGPAMKYNRWLAGQRGFVWAEGDDDAA